MIAEHFFRLGNVGKRDRHVAGLERLAVNHGRFAKRGFDERDEFRKFHRLGFAEVENLKAEFLPRAGKNAFQNVRDERVVARRAAVTENRNGPAGVNQLREFVDCQVRPLARAVNREKPQHRHIQAVEVMVNMAERLARQLARGVRRDGGKNRVALAKRHFRIHAVNRRGRRDGDFAAAGVARGFEDVDGAFDVHALVKRRLLQAGPHAGARGEMDDLVEFCGGKQIVHRAGIRQIAGDEGERLAERLDVRERAALDLRVVKIVEVVEGPDAVAVMEQAFANVRADEARAAGDEKIHAATLTTEGETVENAGRWVVGQFENEKLNGWGNISNQINIFI